MLSPSRIGRYEVVSALGPGAAGTRYKAVDPLSGRTVAIRTIALERPGQERTGFEARFRREAEAAARLRHANIAAIYEVGEDGDIAYVAMEYLEGESLREMLDAGMVLPIEAIAGIAARVANALDYAHQNHVVHRDIRPESHMITRNGAVKIMDFGVAPMLAGAPAQPGLLPATAAALRYLAPEQVAGGHADGRADIFALGVVLYEMLTGVVPFDGAEPGAVIHRVLKEAPVPPSTRNARVPPVFDRIVSRALAKRPRDRYQSAAALARDLPGDAASPQNAPVAGTRPAKAADASRKAAPASRPLASSAREKARGEEKTWLPRKPLWLALPLSMIAAFVTYSPDDQPPGDERAASPVTPVTPAFSPARVVSASPAVSASAVSTPADSAAPADSTPADPAPPMPAKKRADSARPKVARKPAASATPVASAMPPRSAKPDVPEPASAPASAAQAKATVTFAISPWGEVYVDGNSVGVSPPLAALQLAPGRHEVQIRNQAFAPFAYTVNLEPGTSLKIRHKFK